MFVYQFGVPFLIISLINSVLIVVCCIYMTYSDRLLASCTLYSMVCLRQVDLTDNSRLVVGVCTHLQDDYSGGIGYMSVDDLSQPLTGLYGSIYWARHNMLG